MFRRRFLVSVGVLLIILAGCRSEEGKISGAIIGDWVLADAGNTIQTYTFRSDGTWSESVTTAYSHVVFDGEYEVNGETLILSILSTKSGEKPVEDSTDVYKVNVRFLNADSFEGTVEGVKHLYRRE